MARNQWGPISEWMPFLGTRFYSSPFVRKMSAEQKEWYKALLWAEWQRGGYLPNDQDQLWVLAGAGSREYFERHGAIVMSRFESDGNGLLFNTDLLDIYRKQLATYEKRSNAAKVAAEAKYQSHPKRIRNGCESDANACHISQSVSEVSKQKTAVLKMEFGVFDPDIAFEALTAAAGAKAEDSYIVRSLFWQRIEEWARDHELQTQEAAANIVALAKEYYAAEKFPVGLQRFLDGRKYKFFKQQKPEPKPSETPAQRMEKQLQDNN